MVGALLAVNGHADVASLDLPGLCSPGSHADNQFTQLSNFCTALAGAERIFAVWNDSRVDEGQS